MGIAGGLCLCGIYSVNAKTEKKIPKLVTCALMITAIEFLFGLAFNKMLKLNVWDYSDRPFNIMGQICPLYTLLWFLLSVPAVALCNLFDRFFFNGMEK
jgi:uncharacterized membrane protein